MTDLALHADSLTRTFRVRGGPDRTALDNVTLELATGLVHGLLGPNGAGKTTLCRIASTILTPTSGQLTVHGCDVVRESDQVRRLIGIVFGGDRGLYGRLSARENLEFWCAMNGVARRDTAARVETLLDRLGLASRATELVETFSRGMKQRLHLARGLVADPPVLLLDEPTVGMDPVSAHEFRVLIEELRSEGRTVLLTTHDMAEAQVLCDTVTFIDAGRIVGSGTPDTIRALQVEGGVRIRVHDLSQDDHDALTRGLTDALTLTLSPALTEVSVTHEGTARHTDLVVTSEQVATVVDAILRTGHTAITTGPPSLEDVYLGLLGQRDGTGRGMEL